MEPKKLFRQFFPALVLIGTMMLCGCKATFQSGQVYKQWAAQMGQLGIYPVFPPREDICVGDVYLLPMHPNETKFVGYMGGLGISGIRVGFLNGTMDFAATNGQSLATILNREYETRPTWPPTGTNTFNSSNNPVFVSVPSLATNYPDTRDSIFHGIAQARLKQVAFPEFSVTVADQGSVSALVPVEAFLVNAGFNFNHVSSVNIKVPQAESYGVSAAVIVQPFLEKYVRAGRRAGNTNESLFLVTNPLVGYASGMLARSMFNESLRLALDNNVSRWRHPIDRGRLDREFDKGKRYLYMGLITEVFYARAMDISVYSSSGFGGAAGARPVTPDDLLKLSQLGLAKSSSITTNISSANGTNVTFTVSTESTTTNLQAGATAIDIANQLKNLNYGQNTIGGSMQVVSASSSSIGLRRTFQYPVAVGVRGVILRFNAMPETFISSDGTTHTGFRLLNETGHDLMSANIN